jgi:hypothetical protein
MPLHHEPIKQAEPNQRNESSETVYVCEDCGYWMSCSFPDGIMTVDRPTVFDNYDEHSIVTDSCGRSCRDF